MSLISPRPLFTGLIALAVFVYPFIIYYLIGSVDPIWFGATLFCLVTLRLWPLLRQNSVIITLAIFWVIFLGLLWWTGDALILRFYPTIISLVLLSIFGLSLLRPPSMIERFATRMGMERDAAHIAYTRVVTIVWCGFFMFNAVVSAGIALGGSMGAWAIYNGLLSYILIGLIFGTEYMYRQYYFHQQSEVG
jgi:uncharacterized membrane protein